MIYRKRSGLSHTRASSMSAHGTRLPFQTPQSTLAPLSRPDVNEIDVGSNRGLEATYTERGSATSENRSKSGACTPRFDFAARPYLSLIQGLALGLGNRTETASYV
jgi:hypothetical protein